MADKKIIDLTAISTQRTTDLYETSNNGTGSFKETRAQMTDWMSANVQIDIQDVYDNGTPGQQGSINLTSDNLNPIAIFNSYISGDAATYQEHFTAINTTTDNVFWGYGFKAPNSSSNYKDFAHLYANVEDNTAGDETGSLGLYAASFGALIRAFFIDGAAQEISSMWPMTVQNGTRTYQTTKLLTGNVTYSIDYTGSVILSDDLADHTITISNYYSTNGDDSFVVQTQSTNVATLILSGGVTINGSASDFIVPVNTRATIQLVNAGTKAYMATMDSVPQSPVVFSAYATTTQSGVTGSGTVYTVHFDLQTGNTSPDFDGITFTAPSTGFHQFSAAVQCSGLNSSNITGILFLQTTSQSFVLWEGNPYAVANSGAASTIGGSATVFLNAGDTTIIQLLVDLNLTDNVNVSGDPATAFTYFSGSLINTGGGSGGNGEVNVIDDNSTNATMFPLWVTDTSGAQPTYVSSEFMRWNPNQSSLSIGPTFGDNISLFSGEIIRWSAGPSDTIWDMGQLSGTIFGNGMGPPNWSLYDYNNSSWVLIADTLGQIGVNPTTFYFMYPFNSFPNSTSANQLMATDSNNLVTSVPNTLGEVNITDDNSTNATMYPLWVTASSGNHPVYVSSNEFKWNPSDSTLTILNSLGDFTSTNSDSTTYTLNDSEGFRPIYSEFATVASGSLFQAGILDGTRFGYDLYDSVTPMYVFYTDPYGNVGPSTAIHFVYSVILDSTSPSQLLATDSNNVVISVPYPVVTPILQQRWVNAAVGSDSTGTGDINNPWATYAHAVSVAAPLATITNQYVLKMIGNFNEALNLYPFVHIDMENSGTFTIIGNLATNSSFNTTANALCNISNYGFTSTSPIDIIISTANNQVINFLNGSFGAIPNLSFEGASGAEILYIQDSTSANFPSGIEVVNGALVLENVVVIGTADTSPTSTFNSNLILQNSFIGGTTFVDSTGSAGGVAVLTVQSTILTGWQLSGTLSSVTIDSTSYNSVPTLSAGALISQVSITGLTDGVLQSSFTPTNYTPVGSASYAANSLTANLAGIDAALGAAVPVSGIFTQGIVDVSHTTALSSTKAFYSAPSQNSGDVVTITCEGLLTSTGTSIVFLLTNPIGGSYLATGLAGGVCVLWGASGDAQVSYDIDSYIGYGAVVVKAIVNSGEVYNFSCSYQVVLP
jgi:hypothetical protein